MMSILYETCLERSYSMLETCLFTFTYCIYDKNTLYFLSKLLFSLTQKKPCYCLVHPICLSFGLGYFGHFSCVISFPYFFPSCPSCLAKCKQRLCNIFVFSKTSSPKLTNNEKMERNKQ